MTVEYREQIESWLERTLEEEDLAEVSSLDALSPRQREVVEHLAPRNALVTTHYLRAILPTALMSELMPFVDNVVRELRRAQK